MIAYYKRKLTAVRQFKMKPFDGAMVEQQYLTQRFGIEFEQFPALVDLCADVIKTEIDVENFNVIFGLDPIGHFIGAKLAKDYFKKRFLSVRLGNQFRESGRRPAEVLDIMCENDEILFVSERRRSHEELA